MSTFWTDGNVNPSVFVTISGEHHVVQSVIGDLPIGIATDAQAAAPVDNASGVAASTGQPLKVFTEGQECYLVAGTGGWTAGQLLRPDANGNGIPYLGGHGTEGALPSGARALENANAGESSRVIVEIHNGD